MKTVNCHYILAGDISDRTKRRTAGCICASCSGSQPLPSLLSMSVILPTHKIRYQILDMNKTTYVGNELLLHDPAISDDAERLASFYSIVNNKAFLSHLEQIFLEHNRNYLSRSSSARLRAGYCS